MILLLILGVTQFAFPDENWDFIPEPFVTIPYVYKKSKLPACSGVSEKSCQEIDIENFSVVNQTIFDFPGVGFFYSDSENLKKSGEYASQTYTADDGSTAIINTNSGKKSLSAVVITANGRYLAIEKSEKGKHVLIEGDPTQFRDETVVKSKSDEKKSGEAKSFNSKLIPPLTEGKIVRQKRGTNKKAKVRIAFYYTNGFKKVTS